MTDLLLVHILPAAFSLLLPSMASTRATAMLVAIALQESGIRDRQQLGGPARGFWQFEKAGVRAVLDHARSGVLIATALRILRYDVAMPASAIHAAIEHNDVLAACFARCLLWTDARTLPLPHEHEAAWAIYVETWRPGKPRRDSWHQCYTDAWNRARVPLPGMRA